MCLAVIEHDLKGKAQYGPEWQKQMMEEALRISEEQDRTKEDVQKMKVPLLAPRDQCLPSRALTPATAAAAAACLLLPAACCCLLPLSFRWRPWTPIRP